MKSGFSSRGQLVRPETAGSTNNQTNDDSSGTNYNSERLRELDSDRDPLAEFGEFPGSAGQEGFEVAKASLQHCNVAALDVPTMKCRIFVKNLGFLKIVMDRDADCLSGRECGVSSE